MRVGVGFDAHAFDPGRPLILGGVQVPDSPGLAGHSDGDVLSHAIADALLGAAGMGDIGEMFPNEDRWKDASSLDILRHVAVAVTRAGWLIVNVDATVIAQGPRLAPLRAEMIAAITQALDIPHQVSVKATTTDGLGFTGRDEGIAAIAVALIERTTG